MIMECDTVVQNVVTGFDLRNSSGLSDKDCCPVKCYDATQKHATKSEIRMTSDCMERENLATDVTAPVKVQGNSSMDNLESLVCDEVIIDGFSILSFKTKKDLMLYSEQCELERRKLATVQKEEDQSKRSRRSGSGRQKRPKVLYQQNSCDRTSVDTPNQLEGLQDNDNKTNNDNSIASNTEERSPCRVSYGLVPYTSDSSHSHAAIERDHERDGNFSKGTVTGKISPLRLSRVRKTDSTQSLVDATGSRRHNTPAVTNHDRVGGQSHVTTGDSFTRTTPPPQQPDTPSPRPSSLNSALNSARYGHLTPLTVTWNPPVLYSPTTSGEHWVHGSRPNGDGSVLELHSTTSSQPPVERPQSVGGSHAPPKPSHCHQFSVAALTEEPDHSSTSRTTSAESQPSPAKLTPKSVNRRSTQHRSRPSARSLLHSPTPSTDDNSFSHSSLNCLPTAPRSGSTSPLPQALQHDHHPRHQPQYLVPDNTSVSSPAPTPASRPCSDPHRLPGSIPSGAHRATHQRYEKSHPSHSSATQLSSPNTVAGRAMRGPDVEPIKSRTSPPPATAQPHISPLISSPSSSTVSMPDPRLLQQMMGIDLTTANQLVKDSRFKELYSLTMANLAASERKSATASNRPSVSVSPVRINQSSGNRNENGTPSSMASSLNALVKLASTDLVSQSSMDILLRLKSMNDSGQTGSANARSVVANNHPTPPARHSEPCHPQSLLHSAYHDRELVNRIPITGDSNHTPTAPPPLPSSMLNSNGDMAAPFKVLPPPPPLTAGYSGDADQPPPSANGMPTSSDRSRLFYPTVPPPPMLSSANSLPVSRGVTLPNLSASRAARPTQNVPSPQLPDLMGGAVQSHWESFFRHMFGRAPGPDGFACPIDRAGQLPLPTSGPPVAQPSPQPPPPPAPPRPPPFTRPQALSTSFPSNAIPSASHSSSRSVLPPPLPPPYTLNSMFHSQSQAMRSISGQMANALKHPSHSSASLLQRRVHPDKSCGRWADAHVRIARHIHLCQSVRPGPSTPSVRDDRLRPTSGGFAPSHSVVRPIARSIPLMPGSRSSLPTHVGLQPRSNTTQLPSTRGWDSLVQPRPTQPTAATAPPAASIPNLNGELEKNPFWNYIVNSVMANLPSELVATGQAAPRPETMDLFLNSVLQRLHGHGSQNNHHQNNNSNNMHSVPGNLSVPSMGSQPNPSFPGSIPRSSSSLQSMVAESLLLNTDHIPSLEMKHVASAPLFATTNHLLPTNSMRHGSIPGSTASMLPMTNQTDSRPALDLKRPRLEPNLSHFDPTRHSPLSLIQRLPHPSTSSHQHKQDVMQAAASLLNGFRFPPIPPPGSAAMHTHPTLTGLNEPAGATALEKSRLKLGTSAPHLAPIRPW